MNFKVWKKKFLQRKSGFDDVVVKGRGRYVYNIWKSDPGKG